MCHGQDMGEVSHKIAATNLYTALDGFRSTHEAITGWWFGT